RAIELVRQHAEHDRVGRATVVRREHDAVAGIERRLQALRVAAFDAHDAVRFAQDASEKRAEEVPPQLPAMRRDKAIGFRNDDVLHRPARLAERRVTSSGWRKAGDRERNPGGIGTWLTVARGTNYRSRSHCRRFRGGATIPHD